MNILFVGGSFDDNGGRASSLVTKFSSAIISIGCENNSSVHVVNGGYFEELSTIIETVTDYDMVFWWANVPNDKPKIRDVKSINPRVMLIGSKRNDNNKYGYQELISFALGRKQNLVVTFSKLESGMFEFKVYDPLGNEWYFGQNVYDCTKAIMDRVDILSKVTRVGTEEVALVDYPEPNCDEEYFSVIKNYAEKFHELIMPEPTTRFLGNSSFRCRKGFPSFRSGDLIFVSRRNIDKTHIDREGFVPVVLNRAENEKVKYIGNNKPSVDTPVQIELYKMFPNINYMVHSHTYVKDGIFTKNPLPCGALEEVKEIDAAIADKTKDFYAINLIGHGCLVMSNDIEKMKNVEFVARPIPEIQW